MPHCFIAHILEARHIERQGELVRILAYRKREQRQPGCWTILETDEERLLESIHAVTDGWTEPVHPDELNGMDVTMFINTGNETRPESFTVTLAGRVIRTNGNAAFVGDNGISLTDSQIERIQSAFA